MSTMTKAGRYEIVGELGRGAMGVVYRAVDPVIGRNVAVKTIRLTEEGTGLSRPELLSRFQTEARAAGLLTHPNIVVVYDAGEEDGLYYITMELVEGKSLQAILDSGHAFPVSRILRILEQTCSALQFAHERSIVHRDIKPANLMLTADDTVKVTDFGTAKILQFGTVQQTTHVMGTPSYMSPEQVKGRPIDGRTDIFSLGVVLYEMLTGEKPFPGQSITTVIYKIVNEDPVPPRQLNPSIHPGLNEIVLRALAKEPDARYQSCRDLMEDLRNYRALGGNESNPDATLISPRQGAGQPFATPTGPLRTPYFEDAAAAANAQALQNRASTPGQTPAVRRTGPLPPLKEPEKEKSTLATVLAAIFLLGVIVYGGMRLRTELQVVRETNKASHAPMPVSPLSALTPAQPDPVPPPDTAATPTTSAESAKPAPERIAPEKVIPEKPAPEKPVQTSGTSSNQPSTATPAVVKKIDPAITPAAVDYKRQIEEELKETDLAGRIKVTATANTLTLSGKLHPADHASLLRFMRNAPATVHVVDDIQYDDTPLPSSSEGDNGAHPVPAPGMSAVHVVTDIIGASATLYGAAGHAISSCQTPCSFNDLIPERYSLQVQKEGYLAVQTAIELKIGQTLDQKVHLEALSKGLFVSTKPAGAEVFINGAIQSGRTPVMLPLAPGQYDLVLRMSGYEAYAGHIQVKDNIQTTLDVDLKQKQEQQARVAWAQVSSVPEGAEIFIDGVPTGQVSPARVQVPTGSHIIALRLNGYQVARRGVQASEGGTLNVTETLYPK